MSKLGILEKARFTLDQFDLWLASNNERQVFGAQAPKPKVFGIGLSRTGTRSLNRGLQAMGYVPVHYPLDPDTYNEIANGQYDLTLLKHHDGLTDITVAPFYAQLDKMYPGSKFILTVRDKNGWLRSCENHWLLSRVDEETDDPERLRRLEIRRFFRAATYGCYDFAPERFSWVYDQHVKNVTEYFKDKPGQLLVIDICAGEGFEKLAAFLNAPTPCMPFPHNGGGVTQLVAEARAQQGTRPALNEQDLTLEREACRKVG